MLQSYEVHAHRVPARLPLRMNSEASMVRNEVLRRARRQAVSPSPGRLM